MFDIPPKCPALANKLTGIFGWRHTYKVSQKHEGISHNYLQKSYSLTLPRRPSSPFSCDKEPDSWVAVHHLQTQSGILDPDDCLRDVADDREQILASFEDSGPDPGVPQGGGDGASGSSSVGTGSPDIFRDPTNTDATTGNNPNATIPHIEVTSTTAGPMTGLGLQVRRSSDPNLLASLANQSEANKRWSAAAPACRGDSPERIMDKVVYLSPQWEEEDDIAHQSPQPQQTFARSGRLSMQFLGDGNGYKWMEAAEKLQTQNYSTKSLPRETGKRKEPLGQAYESIREKDGEMLLIINEYGGPLGLTAIPDSENGGLIVQHVEVGSRAERGRLRRGDRILEINGTKLIGLSEGKVQDHLRRSLESSELRVRVIRGDKLGQPSRRDSKVAEMIEAEEKASSAGTKVATVSPTRKSHTAPVGTSLQVANTRKLGRKIEIILKKGPHGLGFSVTTRDNPAGGHCPIYIKNILPRGAAIEDGRLKPGDRLLEVDGIPMTGKTQSDVVSILRSTQSGATVRIVVSRQQELVEVDEREINFSEEQELATSTPPKPPPPVLPSSGNDVKKSSSSRSLFEQHQQQQQAQLNESQHFIDGGSESAASSDSLQAGIAWRSREVLTLHIPVHDTEKAGLGVSVKGKTNSSNSSSGSNGSVKHDGDLGIFVKNVIHGGAASRDGRLRMNDQLLSVNGVSLLGQSNAEAMETLRRAMVNTPGKHPGVITLSVARKITRSHSSGDILENTNDSSNTSENSGATVIYLSPDKKDNRDMNRWSNPVLDRLTGGVCSSNSNQNRRPPPPLSNTVPHGLRNDSYYMATNDTWSPALQPSHLQHMGHVNNSVLIEDDPEPMSPTLPHRPNDSVSTQQSTTSNGGVNFDATYSSQLSLETNNSGAEHFSRDAIGRRSISEKHHAALDARETGTYQRNKKLREDRERERRLQLTKSAVFGGSVESLSTRIANANHQMASGKYPQTDLRSEALDQLGELGPSLGLKKSSSLESLQTMVQEIQMSDEPRGPSALRAPRGRGREDSLRAAVVEEHDKNKPRKHWLLEEADSEGGFPNRNGPFQSSLNDGKHKSRAKKPSILRGIGHMFRFGKNRKDGVVPMDAPNDYTMSSHLGPQLPPPNGSIPTAALSIDRGGKIAPPIYQPPPPPPPTSSSGQSNTSSNASSSTAIHHNDIFNHRYQHYANYEDLQQHQLSRRHQHYHSQRSTRSPEVNIHQSHIGGPSSTRPASSYYEYETVQHNVSRSHNNTQKQQHNLNNNIPTIAEQKQQQQRHWKAATLNGFSPATLNSSGRSRGPFVTQVTIRDQTHLQNSSSSHATGQQPTYQQVHKSHHQNAQPHASKV